MWKLNSNLNIWELSLFIHVGVVLSLSPSLNVLFSFLVNLSWFFFQWISENFFLEYSCCIILKVFIPIILLKCLITVTVHDYRHEKLSIIGLLSISTNEEKVCSYDLFILPISSFSSYFFISGTADVDIVTVSQNLVCCQYPNIINYNYN